MFGLEIRKVDNTKRFYKEIDTVLTKSGIPAGGVSKDVQADSIAHSLHNMINNKRYLDVCTIRSCSEISGIVVPKERMDIYSSIHCMSWDAMLPDFRQKIVAMIMDDFRDVFLSDEGVNDVTIIE